MRGKSGQDLGMWKASVLDAGKVDEIEVRWSGGGAGFGNIESGAPLKHPDGIMSLEKKGRGYKCSIGTLSG